MRNSTQQEVFRFSLTVVEETCHGLSVYRVYAGSTAVAVFLSKELAVGYISRVRNTALRAVAGLHYVGINPVTVGEV